ncbi:MAG: aconitate hydratase [Piscirickettsiaceae bacterium]|nr:MAG: aconitate hydratase [Piscirickettsiaceae bacterium]
MIRIILLMGVLFGALYLIRWFIKTPAKTVAANIRKSLWLLLGLGLIVLAITGKLNIIFAFLGSAVPIIAKYVPNILRIVGLVKTIKTAQAGTPASPPATNNSMSFKQALDILGLDEKPSKKQIIDAHKRLMQKLHPDKGGSEHLATQINQAKIILLKKHDN